MSVHYRQELSPVVGSLYAPILILMFLKLLPIENKSQLDEEYRP